APRRSRGKFRSRKPQSGPGQGAAPYPLGPREANRGALSRFSAATGRTAPVGRTGRLAASALDALPKMVKMMTGNGRRSAMIGNNATVLPLRDYRSQRRTLYFSRSELNQLLGLYSRNVARGIWRDYAIDHRDGMALFSVFRHTHEAPAYSIIKTAAAPNRPAEFIVQSGRQKLRVSRSLAEALEFFQTPWLSLVVAEPA